MVYIDTIPYDIVYKRKVYLPRDTGSMYNYSMVILLNKDINSNISLMNGESLIADNGRYKQYYIEPMYRQKILNKQVVVNFKKDREGLYKYIEDNAPVRTSTAFTTIDGRNLYYDLYKYMDIYSSNFKRSLNVKTKVSSFCAYLKSIIEQSKFNVYNKKMILIDVNSWMNDKIDISSMASTSINDNPVMYISMAIKKYLSELKSLGDIDICFYTTDMILRINPNNYTDDKVFNQFKLNMNKLLKTVTIDELDPESDSYNPVISDAVADVPDKSTNARGEESKKRFKATTSIDENPDEDEFIEDEPEETQSVDDEPIILTDEDEDSNAEIMDETPKMTPEEEYDEVISAMGKERSIREDTRSDASKARDKTLREFQDNINVYNSSIKELQTYTPDDYVIDTIDVSNKITSTNDNIKKIKYANFEKSYNDKLMHKDTLAIITNLNNMNIPVFIKDIKVEDSSDELNYKETYTITLEDSNRVRHNLKFDMPKFIDDKFLYLSGNKKIITKQLTMKPIAKAGPDTVQVSGNYNKIFIERFGNKMSAPMTKFKKVVVGSNLAGVTVRYGDSTMINKDYKSLIEFDEISSQIYSIKTKKAEFIFNHKDIKDRLGNTKIPDNKMCIGFYSDGTPIWIDFTTEKVNDKSLIEFIIYNLGDEAIKLYDEMGNSGTKFTFSRALIMNKNVPIILLLGYCEGLTTVLKKGKINHYFTDKRPNVGDDKGVIRFSDGYLVFDKQPYQNALLLNGLLTIPTKAYSFSDFDGTDVYLDIFDSVYGARNLANAFDTFYQFMIDPITKEILESLGYPTDFVSVILCANDMLADNSYILENNMNLYRIRSNEIVNALLHKEIASAYAKYRMTANNKHPVKISIPQDAILKDIMATNTVEDYSTINPIYELTKTRNATPKGVSGINLTEAYTIDKRSYDNTMTGIIGVSAPPDANVGIVRHLTLEPNIVNARGFLNISNDNELTDANIFTPAEMLTPMGVTRDDAPRVSMASKQSTHIVPVEKASPVLISNGVESTIPYYMSTDFVVVAKDDGVVVESDESTGIVIVKYKNGETQAIETLPKIGKNSSSGFYVMNTMTCNLKVGDKVKEKDVIAYNDKFFSEDKVYGNRFNLGSLQKIAIMSAYSTLEDSTFITTKMSKDMATSVTMMKDVALDKSANVDKMVKIGDHVDVGDLLISFESSPGDEDAMSKFFASVGDELHEDIKSLSKHPITSKYSGEIVDIKIYCTVELTDLSPTLRTIVSKYYSKINKKNAILNKYNDNKSPLKSGIFMTESASKTTPTPDGKVKGRPVFDGVLIEFYIKYDDIMGVGDKVAFFSALKSIIGEIVEEGYEPYSEFRPEEEVSAFISPNAILARMVPSTMTTLCGNKVLVELKRKLKDIYNK